MLFEFFDETELHSTAIAWNKSFALTIAFMLKQQGFIAKFFFAYLALPDIMMFLEVVVEIKYILDIIKSGAIRFAVLTYLNRRSEISNT